VVWNHPSIGEVDVVFELDGDHLRIDLHNHAFQPIANALVVALVIAKNIDVIAYFVGFTLIGSIRKV